MTIELSCCKFSIIGTIFGQKSAKNQHFDQKTEKKNFEKNFHIFDFSNWNIFGEKKSK